MKKPQIIIMVVIVLVVFIVLISSAFIVNETEQVIITQFGKPVGAPIMAPGIHFKIPVIPDFDCMPLHIWRLLQHRPFQ